MDRKIIFPPAPDPALPHVGPAPTAPADLEPSEEACRTLSHWIGYNWDSLNDRDISDRFPDWAYDGARVHHMQGGKPAIRRIIRAILEIDGPRLIDTALVEKHAAGEIFTLGQVHDLVAKAFARGAERFAKELLKKAEGQIAYWDKKQAGLECPTERYSEQEQEGGKPTQEEIDAVSFGEAHGHFCEAHWWKGTIDVQAAAILDGIGAAATPTPESP